MKSGLWVIVAVLTSACATVEIKKTNDRDYKDGLRFYRSDPYLLVTQDSEGHTQTTIISLPNRNNEYVVRNTGGLGTSELSATLDGGWNLTQLGSKLDSKVPETIGAVSGALEGLAGILPPRAPAGAQSVPLEPGLYRLDFDKNTGYVSGITKVTLVQPK